MDFFPHQFFFLFVCQLLYYGLICFQFACFYLQAILFCVCVLLQISIALHYKEQIKTANTVLTRIHLKHVLSSTPIVFWE